MASVSVEFNALLDPRFKVLASLSGQTRFDAIGRMVSVWAYCIERSEHALTEQTLDALSEISGYAEMMIEAELGERLSCGKVRIRGTEGRIEWLSRARKRQKRATEAARLTRKKGISPTSDPMLDPILDPTLVTSSASASASASATATASKEEIHTAQRERRAVSAATNFNLEAAYAAYPKKKGKGKGLEKLSKQIRSDQDYQDLLAAIARYKQSSDVVRGFVKDFSTFASEWRDWTESDAGQISSAIATSALPLHLVNQV